MRSGSSPETMRHNYHLLYHTPLEPRTTGDTARPLAKGSGVPSESQVSTGGIP